MHPNVNKRAFLRAGMAGALALGGLIGGCGTGNPPAPVVERRESDPNIPPPAPREFRAVWVSTVTNIDWPSRSNLSTSQQQAEAIAILDRARALNLNAIVLQVRPSADAIYPSALEPWSEFLTGQQGQAPSPLYDPLQFWIDQAHARGLELHAWFNPYRARHSAAKSPLAREHVLYTHPETVRAYGKFLWMDPGEEEASRHTLDVVLDVVRRYDIDGVHIDDYFYPYPVDLPTVRGMESPAVDNSGTPHPELEFPDQRPWQRYLLAGGTLDKADWRRRNVDRLIEALYTGIHREKEHVRFGVSPFGIGRPDRRPPGIAGFSQYDKLYADPELWLEKGWLDYLAPQLYWPITQTAQAYDVLLDYWLGQNSSGRHIYAGLFTSRIGAASNAYLPEEIVEQIGVARSRAGAGGHLHFSMAALMENRKGIADQLKNGRYASAALVPATPWLGGPAPAAPTVASRRDSQALALNLSAGPSATQYAIWARYGSQWRFVVAPAGRGDWSLADDPRSGPANAVVVSAVDRLGKESERVAVFAGVADKL